MSGQEHISEQDLKAALMAAQKWWAEMGVETPPSPPMPRAAAPQRALQEKSTEKAPSAKPARAPEPPSASLTEKIASASALCKAAPSLDALQKTVENFDAGILSDHALGAVFSRGQAGADVMVIGEAPGRASDEAGAPLTGPAGQLLDLMLAAIGRSETNAYIANVCPWRPPENRRPTDDELALCLPFITRHIELAAPKIIILLGGVSLQALTGKRGITKLRGQWQTLTIGGRDIPAMPLYHPAFLLRRPELKKDAWRDLLAIKEKANS